MKSDDEMSADSDAVVMTPATHRPPSTQAVSLSSKHILPHDYKSTSALSVIFMFHCCNHMIAYLLGLSFWIGEKYLEKH